MILTWRQPLSRIKVYNTISIARVCELIPFSTRQKVEHVLIDASRNFDLQARVDHRSESVSFGQDLSGAHREAFPADDSPVYQVPSVLLSKWIKDSFSLLRRWKFRETKMGWIMSRKID